ncbi:EAL domain-containing protein [Nonomuraea typhae]|uniref:EAL domain-containing protein n=1 Tax=Nonomuraea typhae TaxID=2603600 RepID=UPI001FE7A331|nr:EAL domain-containing protein [Nonomuraea typhae]
MDLDTGAVIATHATDSVPQGPLPLLLDLPVQVVLNGAGALAPLHEALRRAGRHPREVVLTLRGTCTDNDRELFKVGLDGLRTLGYLLAFSGAGGVPLDLIAHSSPYLLTIEPELLARMPRDHRSAAVARAISTLARGLGAHVLASSVETEAELAAARDSGVRLAYGPLLAPGPDGRVHVPLPKVEETPEALMLGPRVQELLMPAVTLPAQAVAEDVVAAFGHEPSITSVILVDEYQRPKGSLDRSRFLLSFAARYGHALHGKKPAHRLADPPRTVPRTTPAVAAMQAAGRDSTRVYDDLVVTDELNRCLGIVRVSDLMRHVAKT